MIADDLIYFNGTGLYCPYGDFYLDPQQPVTNAVISHAHGDHAVGAHTNIYCTAATHQFMLSRYGNNAGEEFYIVPYHQKFTIGKVHITLIPAGHMLGSAQVLIEYQGIKYLYTGDYKLQPDATCEPYEFVNADVLITESTFANPETKHPDPDQEIMKLAAIKMNIMLGAYALGKSQRLIRMISDLVPRKKILIHHKILPLCQIYEKNGFRLGKYEIYNRKAMKVQDEYIYIVPPFTFNSYHRAVGVKRLFASGWRNLQVNDQDTLMISDHVDWQDILTVVEKTQPTQVWTLHGDGKHLAANYSNTIFVKMLS